MKSFRKACREILEVIRKNKILFIVSVLVDFIFLSVFVFFYLHVMRKILDYLVAITEILKDVQNDMSFEGMMQMFQVLSGRTDFSASYSGLLNYVFILVIGVFVLWILFQGINFFISAKIVEKTELWNYIGKFSLFSLFFYVLIVLGLWLRIYLSLINFWLPVVSEGVLNFLVLSMIAVLCYFWLISLVFIRKRKILKAFLDTFRLGVLRFVRIIFVFFVLVVILDVFLAFVYLTYYWNAMLFSTLLLLLVIPMISVLRISFFYFIEKIK